MVDKGWLDSMEHFARCVISGAEPALASAADGLWNSRMSAAAIESRSSGTVVTFD